ncbi:ABC transporter G family member 22 [Trichonephila clavipes]|uniref:ABC transporter G family member 22 n=1 Tax=Trichonephila clavipes TaxID=2585209 RepID=A0A8X6RJG5_TRICX|nr:ABC transporter G family member 22 [Trichonephila clavipes]
MLPLSYGLEVIHFLEHPHQNRPTIRSQEPPKRKPEESLGCDGSRRGSSTPTHIRHKPVELVFKDVCVSKKEKVILKNISGMVRPGEILAIMGPSGSGKTTLLNAIGGRSPINSGMVTYNGENLNKQWRRKIVVVAEWSWSRTRELQVMNLRLAVHHRRVGKRKIMPTFTVICRCKEKATTRKKRTIGKKIPLSEGKVRKEDKKKKGPETPLLCGEKKMELALTVIFRYPHNRSHALVPEPPPKRDPTSLMEQEHAFGSVVNKRPRDLWNGSDYPTPARKKATQRKYAALLRLPENMPKAEKMRSVENIIDILGLRSCQNTIIGGDGKKKGLSGGEKKRANIACELLTNPSIMLLDEPTSGLDSSTAFSVMKCLKALANQSRSLVVTVHQPSSQIFFMFDKLLLLCNGQVAYFGYANKVVDYFSALGMQIQNHYNPADFIMEQVKKDAENADKIINAAYKQRKDNDYPKELSDEFCLSEVVIESTSPYEGSNGKSVELIDWGDINRRDETCEPYSEAFIRYTSQESMDQSAPGELSAMIDQDKKLTSVYSKVESRDDDDSGRSSWSEVATSSAFSSQMDLNEEKKWPTSFFTQMLVLTRRNSNECWKKIISPLNLLQTVLLGFITGACWFLKNRSEETINDVDGWMFFSATYWMLFSLFGALISFPPEREVINKERLSGSYRLSAYYIAKMISELPLVITLPSIFHLISYAMMGCYSFANFFNQLGLLLLNVLVSQSVGLFIGATCYNIQTAITASAIFSLSSMLFGGYYSTSLPSWLKPIRFTSMVYYAFKNMQIVEYGYGHPVSCATNNSLYESCYRTNSTGFIEYEDIVGRNEPFGLLGNTLILILFLIVFRVLGYIVLRCRTPE